MQQLQRPAARPDSFPDAGMYENPFIPNLLSDPTRKYHHAQAAEVHQLHGQDLPTEPNHPPTCLRARAVSLAVSGRGADLPRPSADVPSKSISSVTSFPLAMTNKDPGWQADRRGDERPPGGRWHAVGRVAICQRPGKRDGTKSTCAKDVACELVQRSKARSDPTRCSHPIQQGSSCVRSRG